MLTLTLSIVGHAYTLKTTEIEPLTLKCQLQTLFY